MNNNRFFLKTISFLALLLVAAAPLHANMVVSNVILHFEPGQPTRQDVEIENTGDETMYVEIRPHRVLNPGTENEQREYISDPREAGLLVTPNRLVLPPNGRKLLRFVDLQSGSNSERVYRVAVTPVAGELEATSSGLKIMIGYEILVLAQPAMPEPMLVANRVGQQMLFRNDGNTNVYLREGRQCPSKDAAEEDCVALGAKRLYPGNEWSLDLPFDRPVEYNIGIGSRSTLQTWN